MPADVHDPPRAGQAPRFVRLLKLVHPLPSPAPRKKPQRPPPIFTAEETRLLRASLKTARGLFGTWTCLAAAMYVSSVTIENAAAGRMPVSPAVAIRLARALGVPLDALLRPGLRPVKAPCPTCGGAA